MKVFTRTETRFSLCDLNCALCSMHLGGCCPGCGGGAGNQSCAIAKCSLEHGGVPFCWECPEYPCSRYDGFDDGDSFVPHRNRQKDIAQAKELGLVSHVYPAEELMDKALELANAIAANAQVAVRQSKAAIRRGLQTDMATGTAYETEAFGLCFSTEDQKDAMRAFVNKEKVTAFKNR